MRFVGVLLVIVGAAIIWLLGIQGLTPQDAVAQIRSSLGV